MNCSVNPVSSLKIYSPVEVGACIENSARIGASQYSERAYVNGREIIYMSEVDPHSHEDDFRFDDSSPIWSILFHAVDSDYVFVFHHGGDVFTEFPEKGKVYHFDSNELHAFIHKDRVQYFSNEQYWESSMIKDSVIRCVFEFVAG